MRKLHGYLSDYQDTASGTPNNDELASKLIAELKESNDGVNYLTHLDMSYGGNITIGSASITALPQHLFYTENIPISDAGATPILNEIQQILDIIPQISSYQSSNTSYASQNSQKTTAIAETNQKIAGLQSQAYMLQSQATYGGYTIFQFSLKYGSYKAAEEILKSNPKAIEQLGASSISPLQMALLTDNKPGIELIQKFGGNVELELKNAISKNHAKTIGKILEARPELLNKLDDEGKSPLYHALSQNNLKIAELLLKQGAITDSLIHKALVENNLQIIKDLLALEPDLLNGLIQNNSAELTDEFVLFAESLRDHNGNNLLHLACQNDNYQLAIHLSSG